MALSPPGLRDAAEVGTQVSVTMDDDMGLGLSDDEPEVVVDRPSVSSPVKTSPIALGGSHPGATAVVSSYKDAKVLTEVRTSQRADVPCRKVCRDIARCLRYAIHSIRSTQRCYKRQRRESASCWRRSWYAWCFGGGECVCRTPPPPPTSHGHWRVVPLTTTHR